MSKSVSEQDINQYPVDCDDCENTPNMELKAAWFSRSGVRFSLYQCSQCKDVVVYMDEGPEE